LFILKVYCVLFSVKLILEFTIALVFYWEEAGVHSEDFVSCIRSTRTATGITGDVSGRLKTRDWKTRHRQKYRGRKHGTRKPGTKSQWWKTRDQKTWHQIAGVENARLENPAPTRRSGKRKNKLHGQPMEQFLQFIEITVSLIL